MFAASKTASVSTGGYQISRSLRFNEADTAYLNRTPATTTNRRTWTWSGWVKRGVLGGNDPLFTAYGGSASTGTYIIFNPSADTPQDGLQVAMYTGTHALLLRTTAVYRDPSAWYHIVVAMDTTQATSSDRVKIYVNGVQITSFNTATYPTQNLDTDVNTTREHAIGRFPTFSQNYDGLMTETYLIDGQALTPSSFGQTDAQTGVWTPIAYSGSYGTNGFYLNFSDNSNTTAATLGKDYSGNGNNWTPNNFSVTAGAGNDSLVDSPTSYGTDTGVGGTVRGNYATLNPLIKPVGTVAYSNGNLDATNSTANWNAIGGTIGISTGKWYWEYISGGQNTFFGIQVPSINFSSGNPQDSNASAGSVLLCDDNQYQIDYNTRVAYTSTSHPSGTIVGVAVDMDAGTIVFYLNGTSQGSITWTSSAAYGKTVIPMAIAYNSGYVTTANFGQRPFAYTAPSGFKALCTQNLPTPTIGATTATQAGTYFNTITWSGTGSGTSRSLTGVGFQPDWVWTKSRSAGYDHQIYDAVRGAGSTKSISSNSANSEAQGNVALYGYLSAFNSDGFTGTNGTDGTIPSAYYNQSGQTYVAWNWKESVTAGFDIVSYTGTGANRTVAHNLGVAPKMIIVKASNLNAYWQVYNADVGATKTMYLNATNAATTDSTSWNNTAPTSSVFSVGTNSDVNSNTYSYIAYLFAEVAGYSKFGSYNGTGSADGPFCFTGFKPAYVMIKCTNGTYNWIVFDNKRSGFNVNNDQLYPNTSGAEDAGGSGAQFIDLLSNGFKLRNTAADKNAIGGSYIFAAFAEAPLKFSLAR